MTENRLQTGNLFVAKSVLVRSVLSWRAHQKDADKYADESQRKSLTWANGRYVQRVTPGDIDCKLRIRWMPRAQENARPRHSREAQTSCEN